MFSASAVFELEYFIEKDWHTEEKQIFRDKNTVSVDSCIDRETGFSGCLNYVDVFFVLVKTALVAKNRRLFLDQ